MAVVYRAASFDGFSEFPVANTNASVPYTSTTYGAVLNQRGYAAPHCFSWLGLELELGLGPRVTLCVVVTLQLHHWPGPHRGRNSLGASTHHEHRRRVPHPACLPTGGPVVGVLRGDVQLAACWRSGVRVRAASLPQLCELGFGDVEAVCVFVFVRVCVVCMNQVPEHYHRADVVG